MWSGDAAVSTSQADRIDRILDEYRKMNSAQLERLAESGRFIDDIRIDLWKLTRYDRVLDTAFVSLQNITRSIAISHRDAGRIDSEHEYLASVAALSAVTSILIENTADKPTVALLAGAWPLSQSRT